MSTPETRPSGHEALILWLRDQAESQAHLATLRPDGPERQAMEERSRRMAESADALAAASPAPYAAPETRPLDRERWIRETVAAVRDRALRGQDETFRAVFDYASACAALDEALASIPSSEETRPSDREKAEAIVREQRIAGLRRRTQPDWIGGSGPSWRDVAFLLDVIDEQAQALAAERAAGAASREIIEAQLRGWRDFFSGQPREMPYRGSEGEAKESQLNFAWCRGYDEASESDLWKLMVSRADRADAQANAAFAAGAARERERLTELVERVREMQQASAAAENLSDRAPQSEWVAAYERSGNAAAAVKAFQLP